MALDTLMRLQAGYNDQVMQGVNQLSDTLSKTIRERGQRSVEQDALKFFSDGDISPEKIQKFQEMNPGVPAQQIMSMAATIGNQVEAKAMKDIYNSFSEYLISTEDISENGMRKFVESRPDLMNNPTRKSAFMQLYPQFVSTMGNLIKQKRGEWIPVGEGIYNTTTKETIAGLKKQPGPYKIGQIVLRKGAGGKEEQNTVASLNEDGSPVFKDAWVDVTKPDKFEVNVSNEVETILGGMFPGYYTNKAAREKALAYYATPEGSKRVQAAAAEYNKSKAPAIYNFTQTSEGIVPGNVRTGQMGPPAVSPTGGPYGKAIPAADLSKIADLNVMDENLKIIQNTFKGNYVGPVYGRVGEIKEKLVDLPEDQVTFYAATRDVKDALLRARSGAQINEQEYARLNAFLPSAELPEANFKTRLKRFWDEVKSIRENKIKMLGAGGYGVVNVGGRESTHPLSGKPAGRYRVNGKVVAWDGQKEL